MGTKQKYKSELESYRREFNDALFEAINSEDIGFVSKATKYYFHLGVKNSAGNSPIVYSKPVNLGDASVRGLGWLTTSWHWDFLSQAQYTQLKGLCSDLSAQVYIKTKNNALPE